MTLGLPQSFIDEMVAHSQEDSPNECCGIIAGQDGHPCVILSDDRTFVRADASLRRNLGWGKRGLSPDAPQSTSAGIAE